MADYKEILLSKAFRVIPGIDYNRVSYEMRQEEAGFLLYEVVLKEGDPWDYLRDRIYPNLAKYLKEKGIDPASGEGFVISLFFKDYVYFIRGSDFIQGFCEMEGLNPSAFHFRVLRWLSN
ncbi:MAG: STAUR_1299 family protein [Desulfobacterota bacterium]|nr:STAUR_1299 family protein [Thermodesulfobacteriota bacterium]